MTDVEPGLPVLALNSGSSSLKVGLYRVGSTCVEVLLTGEAESIGDKGGKFVARNSRNEVLVSEAAFVPGQREAIVRIARLLTDVKMPAPIAVGHRIVHGGPKLRRHCLIDDEVQNDEGVRAAICRGLSWIDVGPGEAGKVAANNPVNDSTSRCCVRVLASQEDEQIARHTRDLLPKRLP